MVILSGALLVLALTQHKNPGAVATVGPQWFRKQSTVALIEHLTFNLSDKPLLLCASPSEAQDLEGSRTEKARSRVQMTPRLSFQKAEGHNDMPATLYAP
jgi:hypothetical protein